MRNTLLATGGAARTIKLWNATNGAFVRDVTGSAGTVRALAFSTDSNYLASAGDDNVARLWRVSDGALVRTFPGHGGAIRGVSLSATVLATGSDDNTARTWNLASGASLRTFAGHSGAVRAVALSPSGDTLATASADSTARLWKVDDGSLLQTLTGHAGEVTSVSWDPSGNNLYTGSRDDTAKMWPASGGAATKTFTGTGADVLGVVVAPAGGVLATAGADGSARLWKTSDATLDKAITVPSGQSGGIWSNGLTVTTPGGFWDVTAKTRFRYKFTPPAPYNPYYSGSPDGAWFLVPKGDGSSTLAMGLFKASDGTFVRDFTAPVAPGGLTNVRGQAFSPDSQRVLMALDGTFGAPVYEWTLDGVLVVTYASDGIRGHNTLQVSPDRIALADSDDSGPLLDQPSQWLRSNGAVVPPSLAYRPRHYAPQRVPAAYSPDGSLLAVVMVNYPLPGPRGVSMLWDVTTGTRLWLKAGPGANYPTQARFSRNDDIVATDSELGVMLWRASDTLGLGVIDDLRFPVAFSPDATTIVSTDGNLAKLARVADGAVLRTFTGHTGPVDGVAVSGDGVWLATGSDDKTVKVWQMADGANPLTFTGHTAAVRAVAFSPDGSRVASGSDDLTIKLWSASTGVVGPVFLGHSGAIADLAFSPDGSLLASWGLEGKVRVWNVSQGTELTSLTATGLGPVAFSKDGTVLTSGGNQWRVSDWTFIRAVPSAVGVSRDSSTYVTRRALAPGDGTVSYGPFETRLMNGGSLVKSFDRFQQFAIGQIRPDNAVMTNAANGRQHFWRPTDGAWLESDPYTGNFSRDFRRFATGMASQTLVFCK